MVIAAAQLAARLALAAVFMLSGWTKLVDRRGTGQAIVDFGVPRLVAPGLAAILPIVEIALAIALLPAQTSWWAAVTALILLAVFSLAICLNLVRGRRPDCHCFGQLSTTPIGWQTLIRNAILAAGAGLIVGIGQRTPGLSPVGWLPRLSASDRLGVLLAVVGLLWLTLATLFLMNLMRQQGRLLLRLDEVEDSLKQVKTQLGLASSAARVGTGLPVGSMAPDFSVPAMDGDMVSLGGLLANGKSLLLIFSDPDCGPCRALMPEVRSWERQLPNLTITVLSRANRTVAEAFGAKGTPSAVLISGDGMVASQLAEGPDAIRQLVQQTGGRSPIPLHAAPNGHQIRRSYEQPKGTPLVGQLPSIVLPDLQGKMTDLRQLVRERTLVLFWSPDCGYCQQMLQDLKVWESSKEGQTPEPLVISRGSADANRSMGLKSPILLDQNFSLGKTLGATGTPSAVLVDGSGRIVSIIAAGATAIFALADSKPALTH